MSDWSKDQLEKIAATDDDGDSPFGRLRLLLLRSISFPVLDRMENNLMKLHRRIISTDDFSPLCCHGRGRGFEPRLPRLIHSRQRTFAAATDDAIRLRRSRRR